MSDFYCWNVDYCRSGKVAAYVALCIGAGVVGYRLAGCLVEIMVIQHSLKLYAPTLYGFE